MVKGTYFSKQKIFTSLSMVALSLGLSGVSTAAIAAEDREDRHCDANALSLSVSKPIAGNSVSTVEITAEIESPAIAKGDEFLVNIYVTSDVRKVRRLSKKSQATENGVVFIPLSWDLKTNNGNVVRDDDYKITASARLTKSAKKKSEKFLPLTAKTYMTVDRKDFFAKRSFRPAAMRNRAVRPDESNLVNESQSDAFPFKLFFGVNHSHTKYSDGGIALDDFSDEPKQVATPTDAYEYARDKGKLNFLGITDHNHMLDKTCPGCSKDRVIARYAESLKEAREVSEPDKFLGIYGMEWGKYKPGHVNLYNQTKIFNWGNEPKQVDVAESAYADVYKAMEDKDNQVDGGSVLCFNHPNPGDFNNLKMPSQAPDSVTGIAIMNGPSHSRHNKFDGRAGVFDEQYDKALGIGWRVGPEAHQDNHYINYGTASPNRTVVLIPKDEQFTLATYIKALKNRRFYASQDRNAHLYFSANTGANFLGDVIESSTPVPVEVEVFDPSGEDVKSIEIIGGQVTGKTSTVTNRVLESVNQDKLSAAIPRQPQGQRWFYYIHATQKDGDSIWSAPIWVEWK
jgi:hypothetical protein